MGWGFEHGGMIRDHLLYQKFRLCVKRFWLTQIWATRLQFNLCHPPDVAFGVRSKRRTGLALRDLR